MNFGKNLVSETFKTTKLDVFSQSVSVGGRVNVAALVAGATAPGSTVPGVPGDLKYVFAASPGGGVNGVYYCTAGTGEATGNSWSLCAGDGGGAAA